MPNRSNVELSVVQSAATPDTVMLTLSYAQASQIMSGLEKLGHHYSVLGDKFDLPYLEQTAIAYFSLASYISTTLGVDKALGMDLSEGTAQAP